jgi:hypothetical protein
MTSSAPADATGDDTTDATTPAATNSGVHSTEVRVMTSMILSGNQIRKADGGDFQPLVRLRDGAEPSATSWGPLVDPEGLHSPGRIDAFVRGGDNALYQASYEKVHDDWEWFDWKNLGGTLTSAPAAVDIRR